MSLTEADVRRIFQEEQEKLCDRWGHMWIKVEKQPGATCRNCLVKINSSQLNTEMEKFQREAQRKREAREKK